MPVIERGVPCAGNCGRRVVPVTAEDCGAQRGPWYCDECYRREAERRQNAAR